MIKLTNLQKIYRTKEIETVALENVNLEVQQGEFLSIMGPSGCGKSTLLNIMGLLDLPTSGTVEINGVNTVGMSDKELAAFRNKQLGFVFQSFHLINSLNVLDNVELPLLYRKVSSSERRKLAEAVLEKVGLSHRMRHFPTQLSGGQCSVWPSSSPMSLPVTWTPRTPVTWTPRWVSRSWTCSTNSTRRTAAPS